MELRPAVSVYVVEVFKHGSTGAAGYPATKRAAADSREVEERPAKVSRSASSAVSTSDSATTALNPTGVAAGPPTTTEDAVDAGETMIGKDTTATLESPAAMDGTDAGAVAEEEEDELEFPDIVDEGPDSDDGDGE